MFRYSLLVVCLFCTMISFAQPVWSTGKRSEMEMGWLRDSLHLTPTQAQKAGSVSLTYQEQMDKAHGSAKKEKAAMKKKDSGMKSILTTEQFKAYYRREKQIRALPRPKNNGIHQPY